VLAGNIEIGAAWKRTSKENTVYHSVKLDDPSFPAPIFAQPRRGRRRLRARLVALIRPVIQGRGATRRCGFLPGIMRSNARRTAQKSSP
jgi:hypothetical protein